MNYLYNQQNKLSNCFILSNYVMNLDLSATALAIYCYLMYIEDRKNYECYPSYKTIGKALKIKSKNTVAKYVAELEEKCKKKGGYTTEAEMTYSEYIADLEFTESELNDKELMLSYKCEYLKLLKFPKHVFWQLSDKKQDILDETIVVYNFDNSRHGYAFDYDSGLVVVWG